MADTEGCASDVDESSSTMAPLIWVPVDSDEECIPRMRMDSSSDEDIGSDNKDGLKLPRNLPSTSFTCDRSSNSSLNVEYDAASRAISPATTPPSSSGISAMAAVASSSSASPSYLQSSAKVRKIRRSLSESEITPGPSRITDGFGNVKGWTNKPLGLTWYLSQFDKKQWPQRKILYTNSSVRGFDDDNLFQEAAELEALSLEELTDDVDHVALFDCDHSSSSLNESSDASVIEFSDSDAETTKDSNNSIDETKQPDKVGSSSSSSKSASTTRTSRSLTKTDRKTRKRKLVEKEAKSKRKYCSKCYNSSDETTDSSPTSYKNDTVWKGFKMKKRYNV